MRGKHAGVPGGRRGEGGVKNNRKKTRKKKQPTGGKEIILVQTKKILHPSGGESIQLEDSGRTGGNPQGRGSLITSIKTREKRGGGQSSRKKKKKGGGATRPCGRKNASLSAKKFTIEGAPAASNEDDPRKNPPSTKKIVTREGKERGKIKE